MENTIKKKQEYKELVDMVTPNSHILASCFRAFFVGGTICAVAEGIKQWLFLYSYEKDEASMIVNIILIGLTALLTGLGLFNKIGKFSGAGTIIPITGFANAVVSPAIEYKKEGWVLGVGAKMFTVAGPVIVYGIGTSVFVGFIYYFLGR